MGQTLKKKPWYNSHRGFFSASFPVQHQHPAMTNSSNSEDPSVIFIGDASAGPAAAQLDLSCRFYGFRLVVSSFSEADITLSPATAPGLLPILVVLHASQLPKQSASNWHALQASADRHHIPIAVVGITSKSDQETLALFATGTAIRATAAGPSCGLWASAKESTRAGYELRGVRLTLGPGPIYQLECSAQSLIEVLATVGPNELASRPAVLRINQGVAPRYLLAAGTGAEASAPWQYDRSLFGEIVPWLLLLRDVGGNRCWHPPAVLANLTIDDPWLTEPYGCLSFPGLLAEMQRERFHTTIAFVPWNYDRNHSDVVALFRANPEHFSIAIHGNNHDRYEFFRYETQAGDRQRAKPLMIQAFNIQQALARMEEFRRHTGLDYDRVMVFPHGICPAPTILLLRHHGFWATANYSNVPLGECPSADPAIALRSVNVEWNGFPALRRNYPENWSEEAVGIELFLGNPVLLMAHQDLFFDGIDAFNPFARWVNTRQPAVRWKNLGEISRQLHLLRWRTDARCEVRLASRHARIENPRSHAVEYLFAKHEPNPEPIERIAIDGVATPWEFVNGAVRFAATLAPGATSLVEVHYHSSVPTESVELHRRGFRNRSLRLIADFRDLTLSRSVIGRFLTRKYYRPGKHRPTVSSLVSRLTTLFRGNRTGGPRSGGN